MARRSTRHFGENDGKALLEAIGLCRDQAIRATTIAPIGGDVYKGCRTLVDTIDEMAGILTGDKGHFYAKWHKAGR